MNQYVAGRCFLCDCKTFRCPSCGDELVLRDVVDGIHMGLCELCGPMDDYCSVPGVSRDRIFSALLP